MKISVAMCTYNGEKFLKEQIDSILCQNYPVNEIVVCDDGSKDNTLELLNQYKKENPILFNINVNKENLKSIKNFEKAISLCTGDVIFLADQDDIWHKNKTEIITSFLTENENVSVVCTNANAIDENSKFLENNFVMWDVFSKFIKNKPDQYYFNFIVEKGNFATGATIAFKKEIVEKIIPIPVIDNYYHDEWIALIASCQDKMKFIDEKLINYRIHSNQQVGGQAFNKSEYCFDEQYHYFIKNFDVENLGVLKNKIKNQINWYNKFMPEFKDKANEAAFKTILERLNQEISINKKNIKKNNFVLYHFLNITDKILGKRQLKKLTN